MGAKGIKRWTVFFLVGLSISAWADRGGRGANPPPGGEAHQQMSPHEFTRRFTVKVDVNLADIFSAAHRGGHGTGFFVESYRNSAGEDIGVVFTNNHVVRRRNTDVRLVNIEFTTDTEIPEVLEAKVVYESQIRDFAVLEFKMSQVKRVKGSIAPAILPSPQSPFYNFSANHQHLAGRHVLAQGNPLDSNAITTFGQINGVYRDVASGTYIQTQTPINPGNSGGPLIDLETLEVIGINTMKIASVDADNVGMAIPIGEVIEEYKAWRKNPAIARPRSLDVRWGTMPVGELQVVGAYDVIGRAYPDFFKYFNKTLRVHDASAATGLKPGDQIVTVGGEIMPPSVFELRSRLQSAGPILIFEVVRNKQLIKLEVPVRDSGFEVRRMATDFVYLSGLIFRSLADVDTWQIDAHLESKVYMHGKMNTAETTFGSMRIPDAGSILISVNVDGIDYKIDNLAQFKRVLNAHRKSRFIRLDVREPIVTPVNGGEGYVMAVDTVFGNLAYRSTLANYVVPMMEVVTPFQFSMHDFEKQFSFSQAKPETRDWHRFVRADLVPTGGCEETLIPKPAPVPAKIKAKAKRPR